MNTTAQDRSLTRAVKQLIDVLHSGFDKGRIEVLAARERRRATLSGGDVAFLEDTVHVRERKWKVEQLPENLLERRVELIGGASRPELVEGMNSGAKSYIADLWNSTSGDTWDILRAHRNIERAAALDLAYLETDGGRVRINPGTTTRLMVAPRPLYVLEPSYLVHAEPVPAAFLDLALIMLNCSQWMVEKQGGIHLYLRNVHGHLEARLWAHLFDAVEEHVQLPRGTIRATVMIDSINGALEADEILFELVHHAAGLAMDPQGYAGDHIGLFHEKDRPVFPDRGSIGLNAPFLRALSLHLISTAHRRGCHAMGAPSFVLPSLDGERMKPEYLEMLSDVERQSVDGHDGTIVVHPGTVNAAMAEFNKNMPRAHQLDHQRKDEITAADLIQRPEGAVQVESLLGSLRMMLRMMVQQEEGRGWVVQGGRLHDRSSMRLALRLIWHWNHAERGVLGVKGLMIGPDLLRYLLRKESTKMYGEADARTRTRANKAVDQLLALVLGDALPLEPMP